MNRACEGVGPRFIKRLIGKVNLIIMASPFWTNQKLACLHHLCDDLISLEGLLWKFLHLLLSWPPYLLSLERGEPLPISWRERERELALTPLEGGPLCLHLLTFLLLRVAFGHLSHSPWSLGFNACMLTCFSHPMDG